MTCLGTGATKQITERLPLEERAPPPPLMLRPVVDHVAALAIGCEVGVRVVRGVVIPMSSSQHRLDPTGQVEDVSSCRDPDPPAPAVTPAIGLRVPPAAVAEVVDHRPCGRPQPSEQPLARPNRITAESCAQSMR